MNNDKIYLGIDLGLNGAICFMYEHNNKEVFEVYKMPLTKEKKIDSQGLLDLLIEKTKDFQKRFKNFQKLIVCYERLNVIFKTSKITAFSMGFQLGMIDSISYALEKINCINVKKVPVMPRKWQAYMFQDVENVFKNKKRDTKATALLVFKKLYPKVKPSFKGGKKDHDGYVDAVLIAKYAKIND